MSDDKRTQLHWRGGGSPRTDQKSHRSIRDTRRPRPNFEETDDEQSTESEAGEKLGYYHASDVSDRSPRFLLLLAWTSKGAKDLYSLAP